MLKRRSVLDHQRLTEREQKNFQILELIRHQGPLTRTELSQGTGFNIVTVSNYVNQFIKDGLVLERGFDISTGGRKPVLVELNAKAGFAIGIELGPMDTYKGKVDAVITDLKGKIVHRVSYPRLNQGGGMEVALRELPNAIQKVLETSPVDTKKVKGIGLGLPGIVDERAGTVRDTSIRGIRTSFVAIRDQLEEQFSLPVLAGNDATLAGYGELRLGLDHPVENMIYFYSDMGASLILNGQIYWGAGGSAGELGVFVGSSDDYLRWIRVPSFILPNDWDIELMTQAKKLVREGAAPALQERVNNKSEELDLATIVDVAQSGDAVARELIEHHAVQFGVRIAYLVNLLNPEVVVIGGGIEKAGAMLFEPIWRCVKKYAYEEPANLVDILPAQLGESAVALGAACWVIRESFVQA